jgi:HNH endonuclease/AP2 domain/Putative oxidoreductase C terminal domain
MTDSKDIVQRLRDHTDLAARKITALDARKAFSYDEHSGVLTWLISTGKAKVGKQAGYLNRTGYLIIRLNGAQISAHRLAWLIKTGRQPKISIDHIDGVKTNNRWSNLREATWSQQNVNKPTLRTNTSTAKGVNKHQGKWQARIGIGKQRIYLGVFDRIEDAAAAYDAAAKRYFGEFCFSGPALWVKP